MISSLDCCGINEFTGLNYEWSSTDALFRSLLDDLGQYGARKPAHILLSEVTGPDDAFGPEGYAPPSGPAFAEFVRQNRFGAIHSTAPRLNPNSENWVRAYVWTPDWEVIRRSEYMPDPIAAFWDGDACDCKECTRARRDF